MIKKYQKILLLGVVLIAMIFRLHGLNWDQGYHLHPDERAIVLKVVEMEFPKTFSDFLSPESPWNPKFFAYGSFPFYLLRIAGDIAGFLFHPLFSAYDGINLVGRVFSAFFDVITVLALYYLGKRFFSVPIGLLSSFFYAVSVLPIQLSHFYAVDTILTCFILVTLIYLLRFVKEQKAQDVLCAGIFFGVAMATKFSAIVLLVPIAISFLLSIQHTKIRKHTGHMDVSRLVLLICIFLVSAEVTFFIAEPYALLDSKRFLQDTLTQSEMTKNAFTFPYTLQFVGKIPYWYEVKNVFLFGLGIPLALISFLGTLYVLTRLFAKHEKHRLFLLLLMSFFIPYFLVVGNFKVGFMRYMLPLYPFFCAFAAIFVYDAHKYLHKKFNQKLLVTCYLLLITILLIWPLSFSQIYTRPNTRVSATTWIHRTIPYNSTIAIEHWDDSLPLIGQDRYTMVTLPLYDPDTEEKWRNINAQLKDTDYIIIASNRLYTPLMRLTDCSQLPSDKCYRKAAEYYQTLFSGSGDFTKVAEFTNYPTIPLLNMQIHDQSADESFTVYDHPKILIFKRTR